MSEVFFLVWNPETGYARQRHACFEDARREAERLAGKHPGQEFHVLVSMGRARKVDVVWDDSGVDLMPF